MAQKLPQMKFNLFFCCIFLVSLSLSSQSSFNNPSFEGEPQDATMPVGWVGCEPDTTPDILPGFWGVYNEPSDGDTFVGLITRRNDTYESITQRLKNPLLKDKCYVFAMDLSHSRTYSGYNGNIILKVWGGNSKCEKGQLLYETEAIKNTNWQNHNIQFTTKEEMRYIIFEANFKKGTSKPYNGNLLIDNISSIKWCGRA